MSFSLGLIYFKFVVEIEETGESTLFIFQDSITGLEVGDVILADVSGEEVESYLLQEEIVKPIETDLDVATDRGCSDEEHAAMRAEAATQWTSFSSE